MPCAKCYKRWIPTIGPSAVKKMIPTTDTFYDRGATKYLKSQQQIRGICQEFHKQGLSLKQHA